MESMGELTVLSMHGVTVTRGQRTILGPIDFQIRSGERWVILGPNGAGKSTLMNILATRIFPTTGTVKILEQEMGRVDLFELRTRIGVCATLTAENIPDDELVRNVVLTAAYAVLGRWNEDYDLWDESRAVALLTTFGVRDIADRPYYTLSDGEKKRVQIARALMSDPELLLLDEPSLGLAPLVVEQIFQTIRDLTTSMNLTVLLVEQNAMGALRIADLGIVLNLGKVVAINHAQALIDDPAVRAAYLGY
jgi:iron complex transport system ATP-binding protein